MVRCFCCYNKILITANLMCRSETGITFSLFISWQDNDNLTAGRYSLSASIKLVPSVSCYILTAPFLCSLNLHFFLKATWFQREAWIRVSLWENDPSSPPRCMTSVKSFLMSLWSQWLVSSPQLSMMFIFLCISRSCLEENRRCASGCSYLWLRSSLRRRVLGFLS